VSGLADNPDGIAVDAADGGVHVGIAGIGVLGPGLDTWAAARAVLAAPGGWLPRPTVVPPPARLPATERRRAGAVVKASIVVADEALAGGDIDPADLATVFTSSTGDPQNCHLLCEALAQPGRLLSPTRFTNSVHNAPAGYWHIAAASRAPSTSLAAFDASFGAGLLEAAVQCQALQRPVLLVACDMPYPEPLHAVRPVADTFAVALLLLPHGGRPLRLDLAAEAPATPCGHGALEDLRTTIPAARALPLLQALAAPSAARLVLQAQPGLSLRIEVGSS